MAPRPAQQAQTAGEARPRSRATRTGSNAQPTTPAATTPKPKVGRPENVADWQAADFHSAKIEADPKLLKAVTYLGDAYVGNEGAARLLVKLLAPEPKPAGAATSRRRPGRGATPSARSRGPRPGGRSRSSSSMVQVPVDVARAIIQALGKNNTPLAQAALVKLLKGEQESPLRAQEVMTEVVRALAVGADLEGEDLLYRLVTEPEKAIASESDGARSADTTTSSRARSGATRTRSLDPEQVRQDVLRELDSTASARLRKRIATYLNDPMVPIEVAQPLEQFLGRDNPNNFAAQIVLYKNEHTEPITKQNIQTYFIRGNIQAVKHLLGIPDQTQVASAKAATPARSGRPSRTSVSGAPPGGRPSVTGRPARGAPPAGVQRPLGRSASSGYERERQAARVRRREEMRGGARSRRRPPPGRGFSGFSRSPRRITSTTTYSAETYFAFAREFWTSEMVAALVAEANLAAQFNQASSVLEMLGTMPVMPARQAIAKMMKDHAQDGSQPWVSAGLLGTNTGDPAMLVLAKDAYHNDAVRRTARSTGGGRATGGSRSNSYGPRSALPSRSRSRSPRTSRIPPARGFRTSPGGRTSVILPPTIDSAERAWITAAESLVVELNRQLHAAAIADRGKGSRAQASKRDDEAGLARMPLKLHDGARVKNQYHVHWPEDAADKMGSTLIAPLDLNYVRIEQEDRPNRLVAHYRREARKNEVRDLQGGGFWIDGLGAGNEPGSEVSVDVRITKTGMNNLPDSEKQPVVVEILTVEIPELK